MEKIMMRMSAWCCLPIRAELKELDLQIAKLRTMRDSYFAQTDPRNIRTVD